MDSSPGAVRPELVLLERPEQGVALLRLNRPAVLNALNMRLREALAEHVRRLDECADTRVIVLTGNGTASPPAPISTNWRRRPRWRSSSAGWSATGRPSPPAANR